MSTLKLGTLLIRTLAKPVATSIKTQAKQHAAFRDFCIGVAQRSHKLEMTLKMNVLGYKKEIIRPLNDARAVDAGANFLSESFVFGVAASIIIAESWRSHFSAKNRRSYVDDALDNLEEDSDKLKKLLETTCEAQKATEERLALVEQDNAQLRKILDEVVHRFLGSFPPLVSQPFSKMKTTLTLSFFYIGFVSQFGIKATFWLRTAQDCQFVK
ncbi:optic atrophy 3 protein-domain-containing protein [Zychaea mexicana]|uniref:optic atrophy 3 protein-domain-containing protein n=1 Tax=Zychaea mexicana TaxID=64656 RepID=UPI0022FED576|nr:optic atrophy 3 protein-domain-containing protein [Zychaea mexicana]KAI9490034.1 optic atrophy 3 protein-domain-containing protein [Zychaea mexicana]